MEIIKKVINVLLKKTGLYYKQLYTSGKKKDSFIIRNNNEKILFFLMTPTYGNLGDQAIEYATEKFFEKYFPEYRIEKVHLENTINYLYMIETSIQKGDIVVLQGGGNFGNLYMECEIVRRYVIKKLKDNLVISMPSTITYTNDTYGMKEKKKSINCFNKKNLLLISRERFSYEQSLDIFPDCRNYLMPDIVFGIKKELDRLKYSENRDYINICIRTDAESVLKNKRDDIIKEISSRYSKVLIMDTQLYRGISDNTKKEELNSILYQFAHSRLVITDRLHGLIFSYITNTPCIVFSSFDNKIKGTYNWIEQEESIVYFDELIIDDLIIQVKKLLNNSYYKCKTDLSIYFDELAERIGEIVNE